MKGVVIIACAALWPVASLAAPISCRPDHAVYKNSQTSKTFVAQKYAFTSGGIPDKPQVGTTYVYGLLSGTPVVSEADVMDGSPCCSSTSYLASKAKLIHWQPSSALKPVKLDELSVGDDDGSGSGQGPGLMSGEWKAVACRP